MPKNANFQIAWKKCSYIKCRNLKCFYILGLYYDQRIAYDLFCSNMYVIEF